MKTTSQIQTGNKDWGFFGTAVRKLGDEASAETLFDTAARVVIGETRCTAAAARRYLDSVIGRHFADLVPETEVETSIPWELSTRAGRGYFNRIAMMSDAEFYGVEPV